MWRSPDAPSLGQAQIGGTSWDPALSDVMNQAGVAAFEESLLAELLTDLGPVIRSD